MGQVSAWGERPWYGASTMFAHGFCKNNQDVILFASSERHRAYPRYRTGVSVVVGPSDSKYKCVGTPSCVAVRVVFTQNSFLPRPLPLRYASDTHPTSDSKPPTRKREAHRGGNAILSGCGRFVARRHDLFRRKQVNFRF
jgi:hypothetical protein